MYDEYFNTHCREKFHSAIMKYKFAYNVFSTMFLFVMIEEIETFLEKMQYNVGM